MTFVVNENIWKIQYEKPNSAELRRSDGSLTLSVCDNNCKTIFINKNLKGYMFEKVLCHELTHVYAFEYNYITDIETEEIIADFLSLFGKNIIYLLDDLITVLQKAI